MPIVVIATSPDAQVALQAGVLDGTGVTIVGNTVTRNLPAGSHLFMHTISGPVGASCGIKVTEGSVSLASVDAQNHTIVEGTSDDSIPVSFTVA